MVTPRDRHLLLCDAPAVQGSLLSAFLQHVAVSLEDATVVSNSGSLAKDALPQGAFASAVSVSEAAGQHKPALLRALIGALCPGGELVVQEAQGTAGTDTLRKDLLLAGFVDTASSTPVFASPEASAVAVTARKPRWEQGARAAIALTPRGAAAPALTPPPSVPAPAAAAPVPAASVAVAKAWMLDVDGDGGEELLDDEDLLTEEDRARPAVPVAEDCGVGASKKACANCSCGRAEAEAAGVKAALTPEMLENPQSACGSCGLGDAFRCAGCPYRGLPSFAPGQKIELPADFLTADA